MFWSDDFFRSNDFLDSNEFEMQQLFLTVTIFFREATLVGDESLQRRISFTATIF